MWTHFAPRRETHACFPARVAGGGENDGQHLVLRRKGRNLRGRGHRQRGADEAEDDDGNDDGDGDHFRPHDPSIQQPRPPWREHFSFFSVTFFVDPRNFAHTPVK